MIRKLTVAALLAILLAVGAFAQDAKTVITNTTQAMGAQNLTSVTYSGSASDVNFLQTKSISGPWPLRPITNYARAIDLNQMALRSSGQTNNPGLFGGPGVAGNHNQNIAANANSWTAQLDYWVTPWGFLKGAAANNATARTQRISGKNYTVVTWSPSIKAPSGIAYTVNGYINDQNMIDRVETWVEHDMLGDMLEGRLPDGLRRLREVEGHGGCAFGLRRFDVRGLGNVDGLPAGALRGCRRFGCHSRRGIPRGCCFGEGGLAEVQRGQRLRCGRAAGVWRGPPRRRREGFPAGHRDGRREGKGSVRARTAAAGVRSGRPWPRGMRRSFSAGGRGQRDGGAAPQRRRRPAGQSPAASPNRRRKVEGAADTTAVRRDSSPATASTSRPQRIRNAGEAAAAPGSLQASPLMPAQARVPPAGSARWVLIMGFSCCAAIFITFPACGSAGSMSMTSARNSPAGCSWWRPFRRT